MAEKKLESEIAEVLRERFRNRKIDNMPEHIEKLRSAKTLFVDTTYDFKRGDLVVWKNSLKNKARPAFGEPAIVLDVLDTPLKDPEKSAGTPYFNEPLNLVLGILDSDGDFVVFHYDKRRFQPYAE
jgi:hypothetical protein